MFPYVQKVIYLLNSATKINSTLNVAIYMSNDVERSWKRYYQRSKTVLMRRISPRLLLSHLSLPDKIVQCKKQVRNVN